MNYPKERRAAPEKRKRSVKARSLANLLALTLLANLLPLAASSQTLGSEGAQRRQSAQVASREVTESNDSPVDERDVRPLEQGYSVKRELSSGQQHSYRLRLSGDQFVKVLIDQQSIDVTVRISGPDGKPVVGYDFERLQQGRKRFSMLAEADGDYQLIVEPDQEVVAAGSYEVWIEEVRSATENDRELLTAIKLIADSVKMYKAGKYDEAMSLVQRALEIREKVLGPDHRDVAITINSLAVLYSIKGEYAKAEPLYERALQITEKVSRPDHPDVGMALNNLAILYKSKGEYAKAEPLYERALRIRETIHGPDHSEVAATLNNLAILHYEKGDYLRAELIYQRALRIREKAHGPEHPEVATALSNLADVYSCKGDIAKAEQLYERALQIREKTLAPEHPEIAYSLHNLASIYVKKGMYSEAEPLFLRALQIKEKAFGPEHYRVATTLNNLAMIYIKQKDYVKAEPLCLRAIAIYEKRLGPEHPELAESLNNLADLYHRKGENAKAEPLYQRGLSIREKALGPNHPNVGLSLHALALLYASTGDTARAVTYQLRANALLEHNLDLNLALGSERQKLAYIGLFSKQTDFTLWLHSQAAPQDPQALDLAFVSLLRQKGRGLDAMTNTIATLRCRATQQDQALLDQLVDTRSQMAALIFKDLESIKPKSYLTRIKSLEEKIENLEGELSARSAEFRAQSQPVTLSAVQSAIPADSALIEFVTYSPLEPGKDKSRPPRYLAYLLTSQGQPKWVDLGDAAPIERAVDAWRQSLRENGVDVKPLGRAVDELIMRPVRLLLQAESGRIHRLLIAPDGSLNLIPFAALVDEKNQYLIERYAISHLTSGRDLLRLRNPQPSKSSTLVLANPLFGRTSSVVTRRSRKSVNETSDQRKPQSDQARIFFRPLPGTKSEALAIKAVLPEASLLLEQQATEAALKRVKAPRILHIATHGFFLRDQEGQGTEMQNTSGHDPLRVFISRFGRGAARVENPLLRSGLALSGANRGKNGDDDGLLTALEMAGLDLWGTKLVVLSACDTGLGEIKNGEGVQGLRRALVLAGSESQVISLWAIPDESTKEVIIPYYQALRRGEGRGEGLRQVQLQMLRSKDRHHPFYWAAFIQSGEWASLDGH